MAIDIVDFPMNNGASFHSYVKLPEGKRTSVFCETSKELNAQGAPENDVGLEKK